MNALYLTSAEQALFGKLPAELRDGWKVIEQPVAFESDRQLAVRANMMELDAFPKLKQMVRDVQAGKKVNPFLVKEIPEAVLGEVLFALGARGITALILHMLGDAENDQEIEAIAGLSFFRRDIIEVNTAVTIS